MIQQILKKKLRKDLLSFSIASCALLVLATPTFAQTSSELCSETLVRKTRGYSNTQKGSVWQVPQGNDWSEDWERKYVDWIKDFPNDLLRKAEFPLDCVRAAIAQRMIFARVHQLPFLIVGSKKVGHFSTTWRNRSTQDWSDWKKEGRLLQLLGKSDKADSRFRSALLAAMRAVYTENLKNSTYPIQIFSDEENEIASSFLRPGILLLKSGLGGGHVDTLKSIDKKGVTVVGTGLFPLKPKDIFDKPMAPVYEPKKEGLGMIAWNWTISCDGKWKMVPDKAMPGYSLQQYEIYEQVKSSVGTGETASQIVGSSAIRAMKKNLSDYSLQEDIDLQFDAIKDLIQKRISTVRAGYRYYQDHPTASRVKSRSNKQWHNFSTPEGDKKILTRFNQLFEDLEKTPTSWWFRRIFSSHKSFKEKTMGILQTSIIPTPDCQGISYFEFYQALKKGHALHDPWEEKSARWGCQ